MVLQICAVLADWKTVQEPAIFPRVAYILSHVLKFVFDATNYFFQNGVSRIRICRAWRAAEKLYSIRLVPLGFRCQFILLHHLGSTVQFSPFRR